MKHDGTRIVPLDANDMREMLHRQLDEAMADLTEKGAGVTGAVMVVFGIEPNGTLHSVTAFPEGTDRRMFDAAIASVQHSAEGA